MRGVVSRCHDTGIPPLSMRHYNTMLAITDKNLFRFDCADEKSVHLWNAGSNPAVVCLFFIFIVRQVLSFGLSSKMVQPVRVRSQLTCVLCQWVRYNYSMRDTLAVIIDGRSM